MSDMKQRLISVAQEMIQSRGYNGFSYRDVSEVVGIRTAGIHYHFPNKGDLGVAAVSAYTEHLFEELEAASSEKNHTYDLLVFYASYFRLPLSDGKRMCLCGILSTEINTLPREVADEAKRFFERNLEWLTGLLARGVSEGHLKISTTPDKEASLLLATLEGAMILSKGMDDLTCFDEIVENTLNRYKCV